MSKLYCGEDHEHEALVAIDICGCVGGLQVFTHSEGQAYKFAGSEVKAGFRIERMSVEAARAMPWTCDAHPKGPPWWTSNRGRLKDRPASWPPERPVFGASA